MVYGFLNDLISPLPARVISYLFYFSPIWVPILLGMALMDLWLRYRRNLFIIAQGGVLLEVKIPREITKSPGVMEIILGVMFQKGNASYAETYIDGKIRPWYSLEMVSIGGQVHFYIWCQKKFKNVIEAQIYAQYPEVEISEVPAGEDYAQKISYDPEKNSMWGTYFVKSKKDNKDGYPIKTYVDYALDTDPKEEYKIDPLTSVLEFLGSISPTDQVWIQILIQAHKGEGIPEGRLFKIPDWKDAVKEEIKSLNKKLEDEDNPDKPPRRPTKGEADTIAALERSLSKYAFETMIRGFYIATDKNKFNSSFITGLIASVSQYNAGGELNGFKLGWFTDHKDNSKDFFRYFMKKTGEKLKQKKIRGMLNAYKLRSFFSFPYRNYFAKPYILTSEEIATIYHFPGQVAMTPGLSRIPSKRSQAPNNLPV